MGEPKSPVLSSISPTSPSSSSDGSQSSRSNSRKRIFRSPIDKNKLPNDVSDWTRKHAEEHLHIQYSECFSVHSELVQKMGKVRELTAEQLQFVDFVNQHFTLNSPISACISGLQDSVEEDIKLFCSEIEKLEPFSLLNDEETMKNPYIFVHVAHLKEFYGELRLLYQKIEHMGRNHAYLYEGVFKAFACAFARLCYLRVELCSKADRKVWGDLYGITVFSEPDLRFYKQGFNIEFSNKYVSVVEAKPVFEGDEDVPLKRPRWTVQKDHDVLKSAPNDVAISLHDKVLGQHAGQLLLELHSLYADKVDNLDKENLSMAGMIIKGTRVFFTLLEISSNHYKKLRNSSKLNEEDKAIIYYSAGRNILEVKERRTLIADFIKLNNIED